MKNKALKNLSESKHKHDPYSTIKLKSSLAFTEDEIDERVEWAKKELLSLFEEKENEEEFDVFILNSEINNKFSYYLHSAYLKTPFKEMLNSIAEKDEEGKWRLKS